MNKKIVIDTIQSKKLFIFDFDGVIVDSVDIKTSSVFLMILVDPNEGWTPEISSVSSKKL